MAMPAQDDPVPGAINLPLLVLARVCTTAIFMTYPACLSGLLSQWQMTATQGGLVQAGFTAAFALSLLLASFLCDRIGAKRVFNASTLFSAVTALLFALFARSYETALLFAALLGLAQGGTYTPAIMLVSANVPPERKASGVGWVLAGMSAGYVISIFLSTSLMAADGYATAFLATASVTVLGWGFGLIAVRRARDQTVSADTAGTGASDRRQSVLLTLGYIGHSWELLGAWAWIPAFLTVMIVAGDTMTPIELGLWIALALHLSGFFASFLSGYAADRFGAKKVLIAFALLGAVLSATIGWLDGTGVPILLAIVALYGFAIIGDSAVLSSAMTDAVPAHRLGRVLGLRSVLGIGTGALAPAMFGFTLDTAPEAHRWGYAFVTLAAGGVVAVVCAALLRR